jgi:hypothetical protein
MLSSVWRNETTFPGEVRQGDKGFTVIQVQGWLNLRGLGVVVDGDFGPATHLALRKAGVMYTDRVDRVVWDTLVQPLAYARSFKPQLTEFGEVAIAYASECLVHRAREAGGDNKGPWVREFCRGHEVAWCQGFASTMHLWAAHHLGLERTPLDLVLDGTFCLYVPRMVDEAKAKRLFQIGSHPDPIPVGSMFFLRGGSHGYSHVGLVVKDHGDTVETIEGNTNDDGSANGYEVAHRIRRRSSCDYGLVHHVLATVA